MYLCGVVVLEIGAGLKTTFWRSHPELNHVFYSASDKECDCYHINEFQDPSRQFM